nr:MAG TPA: hypothetical protein [Bacteriophage sp.]
MLAGSTFANCGFSLGNVLIISSQYWSYSFLKSLYEPLKPQILAVA